MRIAPTAIPDIVMIEPAVFADERGWFTESWNAERLAQALESIGVAPPPGFVQDNHSCSKAGVLRGLHYQLPPRAQGKLVRVVRGAVFDVAVDIRRGSPTFGRWAATLLSAANRRQLWIPAGLAHGFLALEDDTHFLYKTTDVYSREHERSLRWNDPKLAIAWPLAAFGGVPIVAPKDAAAPALEAAELPAR
jgi:dTDP-4-dehydrorhamnose 3,5-epimerase